MIQELLEQRQTLFEIAEELYGDFWVSEEAFWGSPTERQLSEVYDRLYDLGWKDNITPWQLADAKKLAKILGIELPPED